MLAQLCKSDSSFHFSLSSKWLWFLQIPPLRRFLLLLLPPSFFNFAFYLDNSICLLVSLSYSYYYCELNLTKGKFWSPQNPQVFFFVQWTTNKCSSLAFDIPLSIQIWTQVSYSHMCYILVWLLGCVSFVLCIHSGLWLLWTSLIHCHLSSTLSSWRLSCPFKLQPSPLFSKMLHVSCSSVSWFGIFVLLQHLWPGEAEMQRNVFKCLKGNMQ